MISHRPEQGGGWRSEVAELRLGDDGNEALAEAQRFCARANVAIVGAEHLLAGALAVLGREGDSTVPDRATLESALMLAQGEGSAAFAERLMFGSSAREAISGAAATVGGTGRLVISARDLAIGTIDSGNVSPIFFAGLGVARDTLRAALSAES